MEKIYAYLDECGAYTPKAALLKHDRLFIVAAVIIKESNIDIVEKKLKEISLKEFSGSEIKSNKIKGNHGRRVKVLSQVMGLPFNVLCLVVDKTEIISDHGITKNKKYFYEFLNNIIYQELRSAYPFLSIVTDMVGDSEFAAEFTNHVRTHRNPLDLFDQEDFDVVDSKKVLPVQLADLIAGTLSYIYDESKRITVPDEFNFLNIIENKLQKVKFFPKSYDDSLFQHSEGDANYSPEIAQISYRKAEQFIQANRKSTDESIKRQRFTLEYLLFRFKYNPNRRYIPTKELMNAIENANLGRLSEQSFRRNVIGALRDKGVIISSSSKGSKGYKLPSSEKEIYDYYSHVNGVVMPMIHRVNLCNETLRLAASDNKDYLSKDDFKGLNAMVNAIKQIDHQA
jgi:hypothetical protein